MNYEVAYSRAVRYAAVRSPEDVAGFVRHLKESTKGLWSGTIDEEHGRLRNFQTSLGAFADYLADENDPREAVIRAAAGRIKGHLAGVGHWSYPPIGFGFNHKQVREVPLVGTKSELRLYPLVKAGARKTYPHLMTVGISFAHPDQKVEPMRYNVLYLSGEMHPDQTRHLIAQLGDANVVDAKAKTSVHSYLDSHYGPKKA